MLEFEQFNQLVDEIMSLGVSEEAAIGYACRIGDTPVLDEEGNVVVRDGEGKELARLKLKFFGGTD